MTVVFIQVLHVAKSINLSYGMWHGCLATGFFSFESPILPAHLNYQYTWNFTRSSYDRLYPLITILITKIQIFTFVDLADTFIQIDLHSRNTFLAHQITFFGNQTNELGIACYALLFFIMCDSVTGNIWKLLTLLKGIQYHSFVFKKVCKENIYWSQYF